MKEVLNKINKIRKDFLEKNIKKTGKNKFANFDYYELSDFIPTVIELENKYNVISLFEEIDDNKAILRVCDIDTGQAFEFKTKVANVNVDKMIDIQKLGAEHTYLKRYLYLNYLNLTEPDTVDSLPQNDKPKLASENQIKTIINYLNNDEALISKALENLGVNKFEELSVIQASDFIKRMDEKRKLKYEQRRV